MAEGEGPHGDLAGARLLVIEQQITAPLAPELRQALRDRLARAAGPGMGYVPDGTEPGTIFRALPLDEARMPEDAGVRGREAGARGDGGSARRRKRK